MILRHICIELRALKLQS